MKTDYTGCNKEIAESLKRGEHIECITKTSRVKETIIAYLSRSNKPYVSSAGIFLSYAEPITTETYVIDAVAMMKGLIERGYTVDKHGWWFTEVSVLRSNAWSYCGKLPSSALTWEDWMLEERETKT